MAVQALVVQRPSDGTPCVLRAFSRRRQTLKDRLADLARSWVVGSVAPVERRRGLANHATSGESLGPSAHGRKAQERRRDQQQGDWFRDEVDAGPNRRGEGRSAFSIYGRAAEL